ncbi:hypothetical protein [Chamaesiphon sp. VAR_48_metabat_135_sub]|uniref:hypothetical protein n=1 Tax=Chamaesiphon sp. VAR_48_metabat_135_sub TaxID=2964699 RepID=UPI00286AFABF|nr:hypothetical protein [Chamaesiphon sp. VAR_48_metabat_135_sub]
MSTQNNSIETTAAFCFFAEAKNASFCLFRQNASQQRPSVLLQLKDLTKTVEI